MLGGRAAEELIFSEMTTGAADDIEKATQIARAIVIEYGMSDLGPINYDKESAGIFGEVSQVSEDMRAKIDREMRRIIDQRYEAAQKILKQHRSKLNKVAAELLIKETLEGEQFVNIIKSTKSPEKKAG
ncbi:MAG: hypothetical protein A3D92_03675 [Bacteroidetes bacterium RIFCSPHIGHO2_02_FULL_44_7]|nr:MAG: hypothetical protein A3D92_03675 [Bacteroidetes bacterium RIFCSPHIGHO2_02_FULL_44_7]